VTLTQLETQCASLQQKAAMKYTEYIVQIMGNCNFTRSFFQTFSQILCL